MHKKYVISTQIFSEKQRILMPYSVATKEKSFREESGIKVGLRIGDETHFRQLETVGRQEAFATCRYGRAQDVRVLLVGLEEFQKRKVVIWSPKPDLR